MTRYRSLNSSSGLNGWVFSPSIVEFGALAAVHVAQEGIDHCHRDVRPAFAQLRAPALQVVLVGELGHLVTITGGLHRHGCDDVASGSLQQVPDERPADAEAEHHELAD